MTYPAMKPFASLEEFAEALKSASHPCHKAAIMTATCNHEYDVPTIIGVDDRLMTPSKATFRQKQE